MNVIEKVFGTHSERELKRILPIVDKIESLRDDMMALTDEQLKDKTKEYKARLAQGETLDDLLPEAYATVREAGRRVLNMEHFRVQLIGGIILHQGRIAEMKTGEGKTLVSTLPAYLNALEGKGVHVVTVNDYLAARDAEWMGAIHEFLGLKVGIVLNSMKPEERKAAYACDITYVTNNELGFDYLRDNMAIYKEQLVLRDLHYAIIDEVDSVLIDEARTPLIISGQSGKSTSLYEACDILARQLKRGDDVGEFSKMDAIMGIEQEENGDFVVNEKDKVVNLTAEGIEKVEKFFHIENLADPENLEIQNNIILALRAHNLMHRDKDYVVKEDQVLIVDEFTGRIMPGRRYSDGLHQAIEAKEHVKVKRESKTLATITFQNFFNKFEKKSGMTGTALTEEKEFRDIYGMDVVEIPTNRPVIRKDLHDAVYKTKKEKLNAIVEAVKEAHAKGQPVLVGTITIEASEQLSGMLRREGIQHKVLNAKFHELEAEIVADAGIHGAVTIATNMAGRGTDIMLGGNAETMALDEIKKYLRHEVENRVQKGEMDERVAHDYIDHMIYEANGHADTDDQEVLAIRAKFEELYSKFKTETDAAAEKVRAAGGLYILGTERHESRRIDNQLRGRSGRQGDPGSSRFYLSMEDPLLRIFAGEKMQALMNKLRLPEGEAIEAGIVSRSIETAQRKVESRNFDIRKQLLEYDDVANDQRKEIYALRNEILENKDVSGPVKELRDGYFTSLFRHYVPADTVEEQWDLEGLEKELKEQWNLDVPLKATLEKSESSDDQELLDMLLAATNKVYDEKVALVGHEAFAQFERNVLLQFLDQRWREHLSQLDMLRQGIYLRGYAQKQPKQEYKREAFELFANLLETVGADVTRVLMNVQIRQPEPEEVAAAQQEAQAPAQQEALSQEEDPFAHVGRNDPCPCGSGKKFKDCHGKLR